MTDLLLRNVEVAGRTNVDVLVRTGVIAQIGAALTVPERCTIVDGAGGALIPGLHDHHIHLHALAADRVSVRCGPPDVTSSDDLAGALDSAPGDGWIRGVGYFESVAGCSIPVSWTVCTTSGPCASNTAVVPCGR